MRRTSVELAREGRHTPTPSVPSVRAFGRDEPDVACPPADPDRVAAIAHGPERAAQRHHPVGFVTEVEARTSPSRRGSARRPRPARPAAGVPRSAARCRASPARTAGGRSVARATSVPIEIRRVSAATAPRSAPHSSAGRSSARPVRAEQVVVHEHTVQPGGLRGARHRERDLRILDEGRERQGEPHDGATAGIAAVQREQRGADHAGALPHRRRDDLRGRAVLGTLDVAEEVLAASARGTARRRARARRRSR